MIDQNIKDAISSNVKKEKLRHLVYNGDVISLLQDGMIKVLDGLTTLEELLKIIELDDDETLHSTGLENAIEVNELTKEGNKQQPEEQKQEIPKPQTVVEKPIKEIPKQVAVERPVQVENKSNNQVNVVPPRPQIIKEEPRPVQQVRPNINNEQIIQKEVKPIEKPIGQPEPPKPQPKPEVKKSIFGSKISLFK